MAGSVCCHTKDGRAAIKIQPASAVEIENTKQEKFMGDRVQEFNDFRSKMNKRILEVDNRAIKRFFGVDTLTYEPGALDARTKEMLGLVASMVLRCDDCISYHIEQCKEEGVTDEEMFDIFSVALVVGGSIVIPHLRRGVAFLDELNALKPK
jgi:AhpD family alkylhydroperoxidase